MRLKRGGSGGRGRGGGGGYGCVKAVLGFCLLCIVLPLLFLSTKSSTRNLSDSLNGNQSDDASVEKGANWKIQNSIEHVESLFPKEVIDVITANTKDLGPLSLNLRERKDFPSSWVLENPTDMTKEDAMYHQKQSTGQERLGNDNLQLVSNDATLKNQQETDTINNIENIAHGDEHATPLQEELGVGKQDLKDDASKDNLLTEESPVKVIRRQLRQRRRERRSMELLHQDDDETVKLENAAIERSKEVDSAVLGKYSIWRRDNENENSDSTIRLMRDQLIMARVYSSIAQFKNSPDIYSELALRMKEIQKALGEATQDAELHHSAPERIKAMGQILSKARENLYDCATVTKKLRAMLQSADEQVRALKKQSTFLSQLAAKTVPKAIHCLSMRLTIEYYLLPLEQRKFPNQERLEDPKLYHYALFSDNVLAASVVVNSTIMNAKEPEKHVFHLVSDKLNFGAMKMWFLLNPPGKATITVDNVDEFKWLNSSYCPVLRQLESAAMKEFYFKADHPTSLSAGSSNLKYRNPKYLSMLNHLRFYLPQIYPKLDKILFVDDDIVVQQDLTPLWSINLHGKVNGAVETCGESFHRFDKYLNFSNPHISKNFDPNSCGWAYGMNMFDLKEWKKRDITGIYHKWQNMNEDRTLWKLGTLPPGLITFYGLTHPLDKHWHVLGLGYNPSIDRSDIDSAAVVHYNGNMKPWLELAMTKYRPYWTKYIKYDHPYLQQCNINE